MCVLPAFCRNPFSKTSSIYRNSERKKRHFIGIRSSKNVHLSEFRVLKMSIYRNLKRKKRRFIGICVKIFADLQYFT